MVSGPKTQVVKPGKETATKRGTLSRQRILRTALRIVQKEGVESLTMRRLAREFKVQPTAIYWHVQSRDDLMQGVLDIALERVELVLSTEGPWDEQVRRLCRTIRDEVSAHPYVFWLQKRLPANLGGPVTATFLRLVGEAGYEGRDAAEIVRMLHDYSVGAAYMKTLSSTSDELIQRWIASGEATAEEISSVRKYREQSDRDAAFERGLELLVSGLSAPRSRQRRQESAEVVTGIAELKVGRPRQPNNGTTARSRQRS